MNQPGGGFTLVLVHDGSRTDVGALADQVWYPVWDTGVGLDPSVRTVEEANLRLIREALA